MSLLKTSAVVGGFTIVSRLLGFVRDLLVAFLLGTDFVAEAFFVAQRLPNLFRALFAEGAFNNAFVPQFAGKLEVEGEAKAFRFAEDVYAFLAAWLLAICVLAMLAMPWLIHAIAPGFARSVPALELAIALTRICFPYLLFISLVALLSGVLNSLGRFAAAAFAPVLMNVVMIGFCVLAWLSGTGGTAATAQLLSYGVTRDIRHLPGYWHLNGMVIPLLIFLTGVSSLRPTSAIRIMTASTASSRRKVPQDRMSFAFAMQISILQCHLLQRYAASDDLGDEALFHLLQCNLQL